MFLPFVKGFRFHHFSQFMTNNNNNIIIIINNNNVRLSAFVLMQYRIVDKYFDIF